MVFPHHPCGVGIANSLHKFSTAAEQIPRSYSHPTTRKTKIARVGDPGTRALKKTRASLTGASE
jgi:hypothetical protein